MKALKQVELPSGNFTWSWDEIEEEPEPGPEIPPPCWDERRIDPDRCWAVTKAMCS